MACCRQRVHSRYRLWLGLSQVNGFWTSWGWVGIISGAILAWLAISLAWLLYAVAAYLLRGPGHNQAPALVGTRPAHQSDAHQLAAAKTEQPNVKHRENLSEALINLTDIINASATSVLSLADDFLRDLGAGLHNAQIPMTKDILIGRLDAIQNQCEVASRILFKEVVPHHYFSEELSAALGDAKPADGPLYRLSQATLGFIGKVNHLAQINKEGDDLGRAFGIIDPAQNAFSVATNDYRRWLEDCRRRIGEKKHALE
jgi:hypothetical protein